MRPFVDSNHPDCPCSSESHRSGTYLCHSRSWLFLAMNRLLLLERLSRFLYVFQSLHQFLTRGCCVRLWEDRQPINEHNRSSTNNLILKIWNLNCMYIKIAWYSYFNNSSTLGTFTSSWTAQDKNNFWQWRHNKLVWII